MRGREREGERERERERGGEREREREREGGRERERERERENGEEKIQKMKVIVGRVEIECNSFPASACSLSPLLLPLIIPLFFLLPCIQYLCLESAPETNDKRVLIVPCQDVSLIEHLLDLRTHMNT